jgi:outer membrane protein assembly factor BamA
LKRAVNPLNPFGMAAESMMVSAEKGVISRWIAPKPGGPKQAGFSAGFAGAGSGAGFGPQIRLFHRNVFGRGIHIELPLLVTYKNYQVFQLNVSAPLRQGNGVHDGLETHFRTAYSSRAGDNFFGIGNNSPRNETEFRTVTRELWGGVSSTIQQNWKFGLELGYRDVDVTDPIGVPSAQEVFDPAVVPGLREGADLASAVFSAAHDTRDRPSLPLKGGLREVRISFNEGIGDPYSFWRYRADFQHFVLLDAENRRVIAVRALFETNQEKPGTQVPFFEMARLGGSSTMGSVPSFRYFDKSALGFRVEYRYRFWRAFDWGLFWEQGQVAPEPGDFSWGAFHVGGGVRFIAYPRPNLPVSIDIGRGEESWHYRLRIDPSF